MEEADIAVIGAGVSGIAAAVTAARLGCKTLLLEKTRLPGGIAVKGKINTLCGLFINRSHGGPEILYKGFPEEFASRVMHNDKIESPEKMGRVHVLLCRPQTIEDAVHAFLNAETNLSVTYSTAFCGVRIDNDRIHHIDAVVAGAHHKIKVGAVVDCSGDAVVCQAAGIPVIGPDEINQVPGIIFPITNINNPNPFSIMAVRLLVLLKRAVDQGVLPQGTDAVSILPMLEENSMIMKLNLGRFVTEGRNACHTGLDKTADELKDRIFRFLQKNADEFGKSQIPPGDYPVLHRDGIRAKGIYVLSGQDVLTGKKFSNAATKGCWPIEKWDSTGKLNIRYLPEGEYYDIPDPSLRVSGIKNLMMAGKCISADNDAIASARVIGTCLATGEAAARLAVRSLT